jgi:hypothetical protein
MLPHPKAGSETTSPPALDLLDAIPAEAIPAAIARLAARAMATPNTSAKLAPEADELLNPEQAAAVLHTSRKYVYAHVRELGGVRLGRGPRARLRFARSKLLARIAR